MKILEIHVENPWTSVNLVLLKCRWKRIA